MSPAGHPSRTGRATVGAFTGPEAGLRSVLCSVTEVRNQLKAVVNRGRIDVERLRTLLAGLPLPRIEGGRLVLAVDVSPWLRSNAPCSADRLFCHVYGRAKSASQSIPGRPYSLVAVLEPGATAWTGILDVVRPFPEDDATAVTAAQLRSVTERLVAAGQWQPGDPDITIVMDAGYDVTRLAWVLRDLPVELVGRVRGGVVVVLEDQRRPGGREPVMADVPQRIRSRAHLPLRKADARLDHREDPYSRGGRPLDLAPGRRPHQLRLA
ncbi:transposase [Streptomyces sp. NPDC015032]|uniref:transposase n=1 Tax=Streptomyces sp. NPDC015032 TaxID=3364937 RepID=UPI0036F9C53E